MHGQSKKDHTVQGCPGGSGSAHQQHCPRAEEQLAPEQLALEQLAPADAGTMQPSTSGTQSNDQIAQMLQMMQKTFDEQLKFQRHQQQFQKKQQRCADLQLPPLEKIPVIDWTHSDGLHS